jgi:hypothetical protein
MSPVMRRVLGCAGLMVLLFVQCGAGLLPLGGFAMPVTLLLTVAMAAVIALLFMEMWQSPVVARILAFAADPVCACRRGLLDPDDRRGHRLTRRPAVVRW